MDYLTNNTSIVIFTQMAPHTGLEFEGIRPFQKIIWYRIMCSSQWSARVTIIAFVCNKLNGGMSFFLSILRNKQQQQQKQQTNTCN